MIQKVRMKNYIQALIPEASDANGLFKSFKCSLECLYINAVNKDACKKLVEIATDEASMKLGGLKARIGIDFFECGVWPTDLS